jgi:ABC-type branched-subunit amino acid transport system substrate-binding protein
MSSVNYQGVYVGLTGPDNLKPFEKDDSLNGPEREVDSLITRTNGSACKKQPHTTLVITTMLSRTVKDPLTSAEFVGVGGLRGAALAQLDYNNQVPRNAVLVCLLVANLGDSVTAVDNLPRVLHQIQLYARHDSTFGGIVGLPFSEQVLGALRELQGIDLESIPIVSPTASSIALSDTAGFHRIVSPDDVQAGAMASFLYNQKLLTDSVTLGILQDDNDTYVHSLGSEIREELHNIGKMPLDHIQAYGYHLHDGISLRNEVTQALRDNRRFLFFSGYAYDLNVVEDAIEAYQQNNARRPVTILGGDGVCDLERYVQNPYVPVICTGYAGPINTRDAHPAVTSCGSNFADQYPKLFGNILPHSGQWTFYPSDAVLWYDSVCAFGQAMKDASSRESGDAHAPDVKAISRALQSITFNGLTGTITFIKRSRSSSDPGVKNVFVECADSHRQLHVLSVGDSVTSTPYDPVSACTSTSA